MFLPLCLDRRTFVALTVCSAWPHAPLAADEDVGVSNSALEEARPAQKRRPPPSSPFQGEFAIHNPTGFSVGYSVRWGNGPWSSFKIPPHRVRRHWHRLDAQGRAPKPELQFDRLANDKQVTNKTYAMKFGRVGNTAATGPVNQAIQYEFVSQGNAIDLVRR